MGGGRAELMLCYAKRWGGCESAGLAQEVVALPFSP